MDNKKIKCPLCGKFVAKKHAYYINDPVSRKVTREFWYECHGCGITMRIYSTKDRQQQLF